MLSFSILLLLSILSSTSAFWIFTHHPLVTQRLDPILSQTSLSAHAHAFVGTPDIALNMTPKHFKAARTHKTCTTSNVRADASSYWAPQLYSYNGDDKTFSSIPLAYVQTYYLNRPEPSKDSEDLVAFPEGFRMIAGNNFATTYDSNSQASRAVNFVCLNYDTGTTFHNELPQKACPQGLRTQIVFPSCWDGKNLDSKDHQSHMSYPASTTPDNGDCPSTHPIKFMTLFYEFVWGTEMEDNSNGARWVLSNGDSVGYSFHADFVNGWHVPTLQKAINNCTGPIFGDLENCAPFAKTLDRAGASACSARPIVDEKVLGTGLKYLPGCIQVRNGVNQGLGGGSNCMKEDDAKINGTSGATKKRMQTVRIR